jgi:hypothetical protein
MKPVVSVSSPILVVDAAPELASRAAVPVVDALPNDAMLSITPPAPVASALPVAPSAVPLSPPVAWDPMAITAPTATNSNGWADTAPTTARDDARLRAWPYPLAPPPPSAVATDPMRAETAAATTDPARKEPPDPLAGWGPPPAPSLDPRRFTEAHWQGIEVIPKTPLVAQAMKIPEAAQGVIIDDVTLPADLQGFVAGDLVTHVAQVPTPDLVSFIEATDRVRDLPRADVQILRNGQLGAMQLSALKQRLGTANGETASMIMPGARMPHPYRGPCTNCHRIGTTGTLPVDQGDLVAPTAPTIRADARRPHRDRGPCVACHQVLP